MRKITRINLKVFTLLFCNLLIITPSFASMFECRDAFINNSELNAPVTTHSVEKVIQKCYRTSDSIFFALGFSDRYSAPIWGAYKISPERFGPKGCYTYTRNTGNCYINDDTWSEPISCNDKSDPFHKDKQLQQSLSPKAFENSGHDRGHIAPRQTFSWNVCGAYQTFSMANMSPQSAEFNQGIWADLESQVLSWGVEHGPIYIVTGAIYSSFPYHAYKVYQNKVLNPDEIYENGLTLYNAATKVRENSKLPPGHILKPRRAANPDRISNTLRDLRLPTGYFKVVYIPESRDKPAEAIGFLLPHSFENLRHLSDYYSGLGREDAYWAFVSRIDLIEEASGISFAGIAEPMKSKWGSPWFFKHRGGAEIRSQNCGIGNPQGVMMGAVRKERVSACQTK
jgi:DNA/RNA endonuclease G (NUC1)